jgi:SSS family solute:Na+ symporter
MNSDASIFEMVENAYQVTLVMAFVPLAAGVYWKRSNNQGALVSIFCGLAVWLSLSIFGPEDPFVPAQFAGLFASAAGMMVGSYLPNVVRKPLPHQEDHAVIHHHAASHTGHVAEHPHPHPSPHGEN